MLPGFGWACLEIPDIWDFFLPLFGGWRHVALWQWEILWAPRYAAYSLSSGCWESRASSAEPAAPTPSSTAPASAGQSVREQNGVCWEKVTAHARVFVCKREKNKQRTVWTLFSSVRCSLIKNAVGTDSPAFIIFYTSSLFMIDEKISKNRTTKQRLVTVCHRLSSKSERFTHLETQLNTQMCHSGAVPDGQETIVLRHYLEWKALIWLLTRWQRAKSNGSAC